MPLPSAAGKSTAKQPPAHIGAGGHRFLVETEKITAGIDAALHEIAERFPNRPLTVLSPLAEGADRMIVERTLVLPGARLVAVLPMPRHEYEQDFRQAGSVDAFRRLLERADMVIELPPARRREDAYLASSHWILTNCDVFLVVWDGQPAQGMAGTGCMISLAQDLGKPIAWVHAGNRKPGTEEPTSLGADQGRMEWLDAPHEP
jgi:hypothetical protein